MNDHVNTETYQRAMNECFRLVMDKFSKEHLEILDLLALAGSFVIFLQSEYPQVPQDHFIKSIEKTINETRMLFKSADFTVKEH